MVFNSATFAVFLVLVYAVYRLLPERGRNLFLLAASYVFYGWWDTRFLFLIVVATALYYASGLVIHKDSLTPRERLVPSLWVLGAALVFVWRPWQGALLGRGARVFAATAGLVALAHLAYPWLRAMPEERRRRAAFWIGVGGNLAILGFFKYYNFFVDNLAAGLRALSLHPEPLRLDLILPVGISFYTLSGMTYPLDIQRRRLVPTSKWTDFALFMSFFPVILAGPIERAARLLPQLARPRQLTAARTTNGLHLILCGLFKKVAIADGVARTANAVFAPGAAVTWVDVAAGAFFYAVQLYADFSGYSDMAVGVASLFGVDLTTNFRFPYLARNPAEFWSRWHISLSTWFRDYVFFPLGGPAGGPRRWIRNVMVTFFVTGLWHGAAWTFVLWGLYHGVLLCLHRGAESLARAWNRPQGLLPRPVAVAAFFPVICYGWILFRAESLPQVASLTHTLLRFGGGLHLTASLPLPSALFGLPAFAVMEWAGSAARGRALHEALPVPVWTAVYAAMLFAIAMGSGAAALPFAYFVF